MSEVTDIIAELRDIHNGNAWHGPSLRELLSDVTAEQASARPIAEAHTIWEIVLHIIGWENVFRLRLEGNPVSVPPEGDFPLIEDTTQEAWVATLSRLENSQTQLLSTVGTFCDSALRQNVIGKEYSIRYLLAGIVRHHVYHAGQIGLLRKAFVK